MNFTQFDYFSRPEMFGVLAQNADSTQRDIQSREVAFKQRSRKCFDSAAH